MSILPNKFHSNTLNNKVSDSEKLENNFDWHLKESQLNSKNYPSREDSIQNSRQSLLQEGCTVRGAFECVGDLRLDGFIEGDLVVDGTVTIGESAIIRANIRAKSAIVFGRVVGDILCADRIELHVGAQVRGNLKTRKLVIQDGVIFDGRCEMAYDEQRSTQKSEDIPLGI